MSRSGRNGLNRVIGPRPTDIIQFSDIVASGPMQITAIGIVGLLLVGLLAYRGSPDVRSCGDGSSRSPARADRIVYDVLMDVELLAELRLVATLTSRWVRRDRLAISPRRSGGEQQGRA